MDDYLKDYEEGYAASLDQLDKENCNMEKAPLEGKADAENTNSGKPELDADVCLNSKYYTHEKYNKKSYVSAFVKEFFSTTNLKETAAQDSKNLEIKKSNSFFKICNNQVFQFGISVNWDSISFSHIKWSLWVVNTLKEN